MLPNVTLVLAALSKDSKPVTMFSFKFEKYQSALRDLDVLKHDECDEAVAFLRNMACVGQAHPEYEKIRRYINETFEIDVS